MKGKGLESSQKKVSCRSVQEAPLCTIVGGSSFMLLEGEVCERTIKRFSCGTLQVTLGRFMSHLNQHTSEVTFVMAVMPLSCYNKSTGFYYTGFYEALAYREAPLRLSGTGEWPYSGHKQHHIHLRALHTGRGLQRGPVAKIRPQSNLLS